MLAKRQVKRHLTTSVFASVTRMTPSNAGATQEMTNASVRLRNVSFQGIFFSVHG